MSIKEILQLGEPRLWQVAEPVPAITTQEVSQTIDDLKATLADFRAQHNFGRGIAAPQIGVLRRIIYVCMESAQFDGPLINPEIIARSDSQIMVWDNCFSFPDLMVRLARAETISVRYRSADGSPCELNATGDLSELLQHEIDHLDGILATDRVRSSRDFMMHQEWLRTHGK